jgi:hypothetical protein
MLFSYFVPDTTRDYIRSIYVTAMNENLKYRDIHQPCRSNKNWSSIVGLLPRVSQTESFGSANATTGYTSVVCVIFATLRRQEFKLEINVKIEKWRGSHHRYLWWFLK